jgi:hypothetical protein
VLDRGSLLHVVVVDGYAGSLFIVGSSLGREEGRAGPPPVVLCPGDLVPADPTSPACYSKKSAAVKENSGAE